MKLRCPEVRIENSSVCNSHCSICPRDKITRPRLIMPTDHFMALVDQAKALGADTISIYGYGEPLLDSEIMHKILCCDERGLQTFITTNASLLEDELARDLITAGLKHIRFSVHGISKQEYEEVHKGLKWEKTQQNIRNFISINDNKFNHRCKVSVTVIPMHGEDIQDIRRFWEPHCDWLEIWRPHNWTDGKEFRKITERRKQTCGRPDSGPIQINADGTVMVCCFDFDGRLTVGHTRENTLEEIIKGVRFEEIRRKHRDGVLKGLVCEICDQLNIEDESPLMFSNRDPERRVGVTSTNKYDLIAARPIPNPSNQGEIFDPCSAQEVK